MSGRGKLKMVSGRHFARIDTMELKNQIFQKIGQQRGEKYFDQLNKWFSAKMCKVEFDKVCVQTIGKENVALHNRLIRSIIQNACQVTPSSSKIRKVDSCLAVKVPNGNLRSCLQPQSPHRIRTPVNRNRKCTNRPSPLGPFGKSPSIMTTEEGTVRVQEQQSGGELLSVGSRPPPLQIVPVEPGEEVEQLADDRDRDRDRDSPSVQSQALITAPFGVSMNVGGSKKSLWNRSHLGICQSSGYLPDTQTLKDRLEKRLEREGVGISLEATNLINRGLDVYMRRLIESCIGIARSHGGGGYPQRPTTSVGIHDFRVAMETNPRLLGEDWPLLLEKLCYRTFEQ